MLFFYLLNPGCCMHDVTVYTSNAIRFIVVLYSILEFDDSNTLQISMIV